MRAEQYEHMRKLRSERARVAKALARQFLASLSGPGPWRWEDAYSQWRGYASGLPDVNWAYKSKWLMAELAPHFRITGKRRTPVEWRVNPDTNKPYRRALAQVDDRMVERVTPEVVEPI